jgi:DNA-binding CsgD family transcriptional regulator
MLTMDNGVARWTFKEAEASSAERISALADEGLTSSLIAEELGLNRSTVWRALKKAGKLPDKRSKFSPSNDAEAD